MNILVSHNYYQHPGGEDIVFLDEAELLKRKGHSVRCFVRHNDSIGTMTKLSAAISSVWNASAYKEIRDAARHGKPDVAHFHNTFPLISPAAYYALRAGNIPVVQTLHNYRLICPNALFFRQGQVCRDCLGKSFPWHGVLHGCYRDSRAATTALAAMLAIHRLAGTWRKMVNAYIALTEFARRKFIEGGLPEDRIFVKPNFVYPDRGPGEGRGGFALFVGRLSKEKGVETILNAWAMLGGKMPLKIVGGGPLAEDVQIAAARLPGVEYLGYRPLEEIYGLMGEAAVLVFPSECCEPFGRVAIESFARGTPVIASDTEALVELVEHGRNGLHFEAGNAGQLASMLERFFTHPGEAAHMRREARAEFEAKYTAERNYEMLLRIYEHAMTKAKEDQIDQINFN